MEKSKGIWHWQLVRLILIVSALIFVGVYLLFGFNEEGTRQAIRWSARLSFTCFCIAFSASSIHYFIKNSFSFWILMNRKHFGISFAIIHLVHLVFLGILQYYFHPVFEMAATKSLLAGGIAYFFVVAMLLTSFERFSKQLSLKQWKILHTVGGYWIWMIFMSSYFKRSMTETEWYPYVFILVLVLVLRLWPKKQSTQKTF